MNKTLSKDDLEEFMGLPGSDKCTKCKGKADRASFWCLTHYLEKEAAWGLCDLDTVKNDKHKGDKEFLKELGIERLVNFTKHVLKNGLV